MPLIPEGYLERARLTRGEIYVALALGEMTAERAVKLLRHVPAERPIKFRDTRPFPTEKEEVKETDGEL